MSLMKISCIWTCEIAHGRELFVCQYFPTFVDLFSCDISLFVSAELLKFHNFYFSLSLSFVINKEHSQILNISNCKVKLSSLSEGEDSLLPWLSSAGKSQFLFLPLTLKGAVLFIPRLEQFLCLRIVRTWFNIIISPSISINTSFCQLISVFTRILVYFLSLYTVHILRLHFCGPAVLNSYLFRSINFCNRSSRVHNSYN